MALNSCGYIEIQDKEDLKLIKEINDQDARLIAEYLQADGLSTSYDDTSIYWGVFEDLKKKVPTIGFFHYDYDDDVDMYYMIVWSLPDERDVHTFGIGRNCMLNSKYQYDEIKKLPHGSLEWLIDTNAWDWYALYEMSQTLTHDRRLLLYRLIKGNPEAEFGFECSQETAKQESSILCDEMVATDVVDGYHAAKKLLEQYDAGEISEDFEVDWDEFPTYGAWDVEELEEDPDDIMEEGKKRWKIERLGIEVKDKDIYRARDVLKAPERAEITGTQYERRTDRIEHVKKGDVVTLVREKNNANDFNAIDVRNFEGSLGYIAKPSNFGYAFLLDNGLMSNEARIAEVVPLSKRMKKSRTALLTIEVYPLNYDGHVVMKDEPIAKKSMVSDLLNESYMKRYGKTYWEKAFDDFHEEREEVELSETDDKERIARIEYVRPGDVVTLIRDPDDEDMFDVRNQEGSIGRIECDEWYSIAWEKGRMDKEVKVISVTPLSQRSKRCKKALVTIETCIHGNRDTDD